MSKMKNIYTILVEEGNLADEELVAQIFDTYAAALAEANREDKEEAND